MESTEHGLREDVTLLLVDGHAFKFERLQGGMKGRGRDGFARRRGSRLNILYSKGTKAINFVSMRHQWITLCSQNFVFFTDI